MERKKWLVEGYCPVDGYNCLMPVEYEPVEVNGVVQEYRKKQMGCRRALEKSCPDEAGCSFFSKAPDALDKGEKWHA